ncbi:zinc finger protein 431-like [Contarinia nasturtii]|uniref:zinc finger protein 431-like n=1 Tax=Contarinia nasturtii TaxID=265458 RepID=UPI0012D41CB7|nr:zinc finger protein 431-like [Contarinia nasturtii]
MDLLTPKIEIFIEDHDESMIDDKIYDKNNSSSGLTTKITIDKDIKEEIQASPVKYKKKRQQCPKCSVTYSKREYLSKHMKTEHNIVLEKKRPGRVSQFRQNNEDDPRPYKCDQCVKEYTKSKHLARHRRTHLEKKRCNECNEICSNYADHMLKKHGIDLPRPFSCDICHKTYRTKTHIQSHMRIHRTASRVFTCTVCPKSFCFATDLRKHMKSHSQNRSVICDICGDAFKSADTLKCHMRRHTGERPYKCSQCPRAFSTSNSLDIHFRTHTGEKPFQCEFCPKRFSDSSTLLVHKRLHTNENPYICHLCGRRTKQASNLRSHYKHFHKNNDISGRQIRLNSRIFNRFSQNEIDAQLQESGDLMALLERGMLEFDREEKEKNSQIEKALQVMSAPQVRNAENKLSKTEVNSIDHVEVKYEEIRSEVQSSITEQCSADISNVIPDLKRQTASPTILNDNYSEDIKYEYDSVEILTNKDMLNIESVFIEDSECPQPSTEDFFIDDIKKETNLNDDYIDDQWVLDSYTNHPSPLPFEIIKYESFCGKDEPKTEIISSTSDSIKNKQTKIKQKKGEKEKHKTPPKVSAAKTEMEKCIPCNRKFHDIAKHWVQFHSGIERPYQCFICHRYYKRFEHLKYHMRTHGDERNYVCHICGNAFFLSNELRKHIMNRHQVERPFKCTFQQCKKCFKNHHALNVHMRTHTGVKPHQCSICSEAFAALSSLKIHERKHTGEKPYKCKFCKKAFADCSTHKQHVRIHTGDKPYQCSLCDRRTAQAGNLKSHYRHYHKIIVKSVSMYVDNSPSVSIAQEIQRNPYERSHVTPYTLTDPTRQIEE